MWLSSVQKVESVQAMSPLGVLKGVHRLSHLPTVTLLVTNDVPATAVYTTAIHNTRIIQGDIKVAMGT